MPIESEDGHALIIPHEGYDSDEIYTGGVGPIEGESGDRWGGVDEDDSGNTQRSSGTIDNPLQECHWPYVKKAIPYTKITRVPGQPGFPGQPYIPPAQSQILFNNNSGWDNSCSSSIDQIKPGQQISFKVYHDSRGFFIGLAKAGMELQYINLYEVGLRFTQTGSQVFENGQEVSVLKGGLHLGDIFYIKRYKDGTIVYQVGSTIVTSSVSIDPLDVVYAYGIGYQAGDIIIEAAIEDFTEIQYIEDIVEFDQVGTALVTDSEYVEFDQVGTAIILGEYVEFDQVGYSRCTNDFNSIGDFDVNITVPLFHAVESDEEYSSLDVDVTIPVFSANDDYIPPQLNVLDLLIGPVIADMDGVQIHTGDLDTNITVPVFHAEEEDYSSLDVDVTVPIFSAYASPAGYMPLYNDLTASDASRIMKDIVIPLYAGLKATDNVQLFKDVLMVMSNSLTVTDAQQVYADKEIAINEVCAVLDSMRFTVDDLPDHTGGVAWVMNISTGATSLFLDYGFNSFMSVDGIACGVTESGIYKLQETSATVPSSGIDYGLSNFGSSRKKRIPHFYAAVASTGKVFLRLLADGLEAEYFALSFSDYVKPHRIDAGRGRFVVYGNPMIIAPEGVSIEELNALEWAPMTFKSRV